MASLGLVARLFDEFGFETVDLIIGDHVSGLRSSAVGQETVVARLYDLHRSGKLRLRATAGRTLHSKLYLLESPAECRGLTGSANFTETGWSNRQVNHIIGADVPLTGASETGECAPAELYGKMEADYRAHLQLVTGEVFDGLQDLIRPGQLSEERAIRLWLAGPGAEETAPGTIYAELARQVSTAVRSAAAPPSGTAAAESEATGAVQDLTGVPGSLSLELPAGHPSRSAVERLLRPLGGSVGKSRLRVPTSALLDHRRHAVPLMQTAARGEETEVRRFDCWIGLDGRPCQRLASAGAAADPRQLRAALRPIEDYLVLTGRGEGGDPAKTKAATMETLLYLLCAPFFHLHWRTETAEAPSLPQRGPRALFLFGDSGNGKSTLLQLGLSAIAGTPVRPVLGSDLKPDPAVAAAQTTTVFPLAFDDVPRSRFNRGSSLEQILKGWWLRPWALQGPAPALVLSSNRADIPGWMRSRVRRVTFEVRYDPADTDGQRAARRLIGRPGDLFPLFARRYLEAWTRHRHETSRRRSLAGLEADELALGRAVFRSMWTEAGRGVPEALLPEPFEDRFAPGRDRWRALLKGEGEVRLAAGPGGRLQARFPGWKPAREHESLLPAPMGARADGSVVTVPNGRAFLEWIFEEEKIPLRYRWVWLRLGR